MTDALSAANAIESTYAHYIIFGCGVFGLIWGVLQILEINKIKIEMVEGARIVNENEDEKEELAWMPWDNQGCLDMMIKVNRAVKDGADTFLIKEYTYLAIFCAIFGVILVCAVDMPWAANEAGEMNWFPFTTFAFIIGAITSMICGLIGMKVATHTNVRTTYLCAT